MGHRDEVMGIMEKLVIASKHEVAGLMAAKGIWQEGKSLVNNTYKVLCELTELRKLVKNNGYFKLPECQSEYGEHARLLTQALVEVLKVNPAALIFREKEIPQVKIRPDAIVLLTRNGRGLCFVLEVANNETPESLINKINIWNHWGDACGYLSELFGLTIPYFDFVVEGTALEGVPNFKPYLQEVAL